MKPCWFLPSSWINWPIVFQATFQYLNWVDQLQSQFAAAAGAPLVAAADVMSCFSSAATVDGEDDKIRRDANKKIEKQLAKDKQTYRATHRLLLLGEKLYYNTSSS